jgi:hypothetical protein
MSEAKQAREKEPIGEESGLNPQTIADTPK